MEDVVVPLGISRRSFQRKLQNMSEKIVLKCQELGLNTCWVAMTHGKSKADQKTEWFEKGMEAVSFAPTAVNQQKFYFELKNGIVTAKSLGGFYSKIDLGIVKYHFEAVTGHEVK